MIEPQLTSIFYTLLTSLAVALGITLISNARSRDLQQKQEQWIFEQLKASDVKIATATGTIESLTKQLEVAQLASQIRDNNIGELKALRTADSTQAAREIASLQSSVTALTTTAATLEGRNTQLQTAYEASNVKIAALEAEIVDLRKEVAALIAERDKLKTEVDKKEGT